MAYSRGNIKNTNIINQCCSYWLKDEAIIVSIPMPTEYDDGPFLTILQTLLSPNYLNMLTGRGQLLASIYFDQYSHLKKQKTIK